MKIWIADMFEENLKHVLNSGKEVEGRVSDMRKPEKHYHLVEAGDIFSFRVVEYIDGNVVPVESIEQVPFEVSYNNHYSTVREFLETEGLEIYHGLPGYKERIGEVGICGIGLGKRL